MILQVILALASTAAAHFPHDLAEWVAVEPGERPERVVTTLFRREAWSVTRSDDDANFDTRYVMNGEDNALTSGRLFTAERLIVGTDGVGVLISEDAGDSFARHPDFPADAVIRDIQLSPAVLSDGVGLAVGEDGIWRTADGGVSFALVYSADAAFVDARFAPDAATSHRVCALDDSGLVHCSTDLGVSWVRRRAVTGTPSQIALGEGSRLWVATTDEGLWSSANDGDSFIRSSLTPTEVSLVADIGGDVVFAATGQQAVFRSIDGGRSWTLNADYVQELDLNCGHPIDGLHYNELVATPDGTLWLASWEGLIRSEDGGETWYHIETERQENIRAVSLSRGEDGDLVLMLGTYGGGLFVGDAERSWVEHIGPGWPYQFTRHAALTGDWASDRTAATTAAGYLHLTRDGGETWTELNSEDIESAERVAFGPGYADDPFLLVVGSWNGGADFAVTEDHGESWAHGVKDIPCVVDALAVELSHDFATDGTAWASCYQDGNVYQTVDRGISWQLVTSIGSTVYTVAGEDGGETLFMGSVDGLWLSEAGGAPSIVAFEGHPVFKLKLSPQWEDEPFAFALVAGQGWYRSVDGGQNWQQVDAPTRNPVKALALSPTFGEDGVIAVAGYGGAWISHDRGDSWAQVHALEHISPKDHAFHHGSEWFARFGYVVDNDTVLVTDTDGASMELWFEGIELELLMPTDADWGTIAVSVDDGETRTVSLAGKPAQAAHSLLFEDLEDGWHKAVITAESAPVAVNYAVVRRLPLVPSDPPDDTDPPEETGEPGETASPQDSGDSGPGDSPSETGRIDDTAPRDSDDGGDDPDTGGCCRRDGSPAAAWLLAPALLFGLRRRWLGSTEGSGLR